MLALSLIVLAVLAAKTSAKAPPVCTWKSNTGANFDLRTLKLADSSKTSYNLVDGDIPCTPETEPSYGYAWNFCEPIPASLTPEPCRNMGKYGVVLQYAEFIKGEYYCFLLGHFDAKQNELKYKLIDVNDPTKGVVVAYPPGDRCSATNGKLRSASVEVQCANTPAAVVSAQEPVTCEYNLVMKSYYGCPTECPVTGNGLCDSHGHCAFDKKAKKPYCYCNEGYSGSACSHKGSSSKAGYDGQSVQIGLLVTLLLVALGLTGGVIYMAYEVQEFRKQQISSHYNTLPGGDREMVETVNFTIN